MDQRHHCAGEQDHGFATITTRVARASGSTPRPDGARAVFACDAALELTVEARQWDGAPRIAISLADLDARAAAQRYVQAYCADPARANDRERNACAN